MVGGQYGHLGQLLTTIQYASLANQQFVFPINPGPFDPPDWGTKFQINEFQNVWNKMN